MSEAEGKSGWRKAPGWMKGLLIVSLGLNLAVAGLIGGHAMREWHQHRVAALAAKSGLDRLQARILQLVPEAGRAQAKTILLSRQDEVRKARNEMRAAHKAFLEAIRQNPLDPKKLDQALAQRYAASGAYWRIGMEQMAAIARTLNASERAQLADRIEQRTRRWMKRLSARKG